jgi:hypothetical protein
MRRATVQHMVEIARMSRLLQLRTYGYGREIQSTRVFAIPVLKLCLPGAGDAYENMKGGALAPAS